MTDAVASSSLNGSTFGVSIRSDQYSDGNTTASGSQPPQLLGPLRPRASSLSLPSSRPSIKPPPSIHQSTLMIGADNSKTPSLKSADSRYFVDLFGRLLALVPNSGSEYEVTCPQCLKPDEDPFIGILNENVVESSCCRLRTYLDLLPTSPLYKTAFTPFGQQLNIINTLYDVDLRSRLSEHWRRNWITLGTEGLHRYLRRFVGHTDDDGVTWCFGECSICCALCRYVRKPPCCRSAICQLCWTSYVRAVAEESFVTVQLTGLYNLHCYACSKFVPYSEALVCTEADDMAQIKPHCQLMAGARCPVCLKPAPPIGEAKNNNNNNTQLAAVKKMRQKKGGHPFKCDRCSETFCSVCGIPNHPKISCDQLIVSDVGFRRWTKQKNAVRPQFPNGRFCPSCNIPVSHSGGCPHMVCPCGANFCYSCGRKHYNKALLRFLPAHAGSRMVPIVTCPKLWNSQPKRILVHSLVSVGIIFGACPLALAVSPIAFPLLLAVYFVKKFKRRRRRT